MIFTTTLLSFLLSLILNFNFITCDASGTGNFVGPVGVVGADSMVSHQTYNNSEANQPPLILLQSTTPIPLFSPSFNGTDTALIPTDDQVNLIIDWLSKIKTTIDVFFRMKSVYSKNTEDERSIVKNTFPPLRVLLEAQYIYNLQKNRGGGVGIETQTLPANQISPTATVINPMTVNPYEHYSAFNNNYF